MQKPRYIIYVDRKSIAENIKSTKNKPVYFIKSDGTSETKCAMEVEILGPSKLMYSGDKSLKDGRAWIETNSEISLVNEVVGQPDCEKPDHILHVNRQFIAKNAKDFKNRPIYTVKSKGTPKPRYAREVEIKGPSKLVYPGFQLSCGARAWIETNSKIDLKSEMSYQEAKHIT